MDHNKQCVKKLRENARKQDEQNERNVPKFHVEQSSRKWGKLKTEVLRINCAEEDAQYLKYLLSTASAAGKVTQGLFIPTGIHLMEVEHVIMSSNLVQSIEPTNLTDKLGKWI